ncbi:MAG TPA: hypothetical protein VES68_02935 [Candidatus Sulfotelmatobacter sp.]|nr:hypothetical protein [Candidatus Sulfotelmatobacter sp.]
METDRQSLTPKQIVNFAHQSRLEFRGAKNAKEIIRTSKFKAVDDLTIKEANEAGRIKEAYGVFLSLVDGSFT